MKRQIALLSVLICGAPLALRAGELNIGVNLAVPVPQAEIVTRETPPPPVAEQIYAAPGPDFVWIGGHWAWHRHWLWIRGHWGSIRAPTSGVGERPMGEAPRRIRVGRGLLGGLTPSRSKWMRPTSPT